MTTVLVDCMESGENGAMSDLIALTNGPLVADVKFSSALSSPAHGGN